MPITIHNLTRDQPVATRAALANDPISRLRGWLGRSSVAPGEALILRPCAGIHMFGMRFAVDAIYVDASDRVIRAITNLRPWRVGPLIPEAEYVVELPAGTIATAGVRAGDQIVLRQQSAD